MYRLWSPTLSNRTGKHIIIDTGHLLIFLFVWPGYALPIGVHCTRTKPRSPFSSPAQERTYTVTLQFTHCSVPLNSRRRVGPSLSVNNAVQTLVSTKAKGDDLSTVLKRQERLPQTSTLTGFRHIFLEWLLLLSLSDSYSCVVCTYTYVPMCMRACLPVSLFCQTILSLCRVSVCVYLFSHHQWMTCMQHPSMHGMQRRYYVTRKSSRNNNVSMILCPKRVVVTLE